MDIPHACVRLELFRSLPQGQTLSSAAQGAGHAQALQVASAAGLSTAIDVISLKYPPSQAEVPAAELPVAAPALLDTVGVGAALGCSKNSHCCGDRDGRAPASALPVLRAASFLPAVKCFSQAPRVCKGRVGQ